MLAPPKLPIVLVFVLVGASNPIAIKFALEAGWPLLPLGIARMSCILLFFLAWSLALGERFLAESAGARRLAWMAAACKGVGALTFYLALYLTPANRVIVLSTFSPVVALLMIHWMFEGERVTWRQWLGVGVSFVGLLLLLSFRGSLSVEAGASWRGTLLGDLCMIVSVVAHTAMVIYEKRAILAGTSPRQLIVPTNLLAIAVFVVIAMAVRDAGFTSIPLTVPALSAFVYLISVVGVFLFYYRRWMVGRLELGYITAFSHLSKAVGLFYAAVLLRETIPWTNFAAFALILGGSAYSSRAEAPLDA